MARAWTNEEKNLFRKEMIELYVTRNLALKEISSLIKISESTVFDRLRRLGIKTRPERKTGYRNKRNDVRLPGRSARLAEFLGIMLGDGHLSHFQVVVTLGSKELPYVQYVQNLMMELFSVDARISTRKSNYRDVYIGSTLITSWLKSQGLVENKVAAQVGVPDWIFGKTSYMKSFVRGFFDTDGSVYALTFGIQLSFTNHSRPLLNSLHKMLKALGYNPSRVGKHNFYLTRRSELNRFFKEIVPANRKHQKRYRVISEKLLRRYPSG